ncbi:regulatory LuxR family protein [Lentzea atacamensis]|uniref:Regulatory LuxR family protein n=1 Tax=Lentzea atacamensis TaxID=531938 RepID=A0ABX9E9Y7_9PSEU|nr:LuxR family transcriptional regulator [Lentzea atacamensis]RAS66964.1 regulatory LuxR family protein [Lentzea atacamensis]
MTRGCATGVLLERDDETSLVARALEQALDGIGSVVVLAGPLGNGKTALLRALSRHPGAASFSVLHASATLMERDHAFGVVRQLLEPVLAGAPAQVWSGPAALAGPVFDRDGTGRLDDAAQPVQLGLLSLSRNLSTIKPLFVLVDDLQWVDEPSLATLELLAGRIRHLRVVLVVTVREGDPLAERPAAASVLAAATRRLRPRPLSPAGAAKLVRAKLGRECDEAFGLACHETTGGNPLLLTGLALAWAVGGEPPTEANAELVRAVRPAQARERLVACMRAQPEPVRRLLKAAAVLGESAELDVVSVLAGLDEPSTAEIVRALGRLGLFRGAGFAHPGAREAVDDLMSAGEREQFHLRAVRLLYDLGKPVETVAGQLLATSTPQGLWAVEALRDAAHVALRRGAPQTAVAYLRRALLDTSVDGPDRATVLVDLASAERLLDVNAAVRTLSYAVALLPGPRQRAAALIRLTPAVMGDAPDAVVSILRGIFEEFGRPEQLSGVDRDLALRLEARLRFICRTESWGLAGTCTRLDELQEGEWTDSGAARELVSVLVNSAALTVGVPARRVAVLAEQLLAREPASSAHSASAAPLLVTALGAADSPGVVAGWLERALVAAQQRGDVVEQAMIRTEQSLIHLLTGRVGDATLAATDALDLGAWNWGSVGTSAAVVSGAVALQLGDPVLIGRLLTSVEAEPANPCLATMTGLLRGHAAVARGEHAVAALTLADCGAHLDRLGWRNPVLFPWRSALALVKLKLGATCDAIALAEEERLIAEEWGAASGIGRTLRVLGRIVGGDRGLDLTGRAIDVLRTSAHRLELLHALRQRAELTELSDSWRSCLELAEEIGAQRIAHRARVALGFTAPVNTGGKLTRSEQKVAMLAVSGRSNQEIAEMLDVTSRAVEKHLTNTYRKLGVRRRSELAEALRSVGSASPA